jgi:AraC-like DNA-binding protein
LTQAVPRRIISNEFLVTFEDVAASWSIGRFFVNERKTMAVLLDEKFIETSEEIINQLGFKDIKSFVKNQVLLMMMAKIEKYESESRFFERKYHMSFEDFRQRIEKRKEDEVFEEEDDYLDWCFSKEVLEGLRRQKQELEHA